MPGRFRFESDLVNAPHVCFAHVDAAARMPLNALLKYGNVSRDAVVRAMVWYRNGAPELILARPEERARFPPDTEAFCCAAIVRSESMFGEIRQTLSGETSLLVVQDQAFAEFALFAFPVSIRFIRRLLG